MIKLTTAIALAMAVFAAPSFAASPKAAPGTEPMAASAAAPMASGSCEAKAMEKKLAGAAKTSFMKKCDKDTAAMGAGAACETQAKEKKLAGAAKNSFVKKCTADAPKA